MTKYKVLQYFQWGQLSLEKNQIILVEDLNDGDTLVSIEHYPDKKQLINPKAVEGMVKLKKIEKY